jgi:hypothetical protein
MPVHDTNSASFGCEHSACNRAHSHTPLSFTRTHTHTLAHTHTHTLAHTHTHTGTHQLLLLLGLRASSLWRPGGPRRRPGVCRVHGVVFSSGGTRTCMRTHALAHSTHPCSHVFEGYSAALGYVRSLFPPSIHFYARMGRLLLPSLSPHARTHARTHALVQCNPCPPCP